MHPELTKLLDLQARDLELLEVDTRLLELDRKLSDLDAELAQFRQQVDAATQAVQAEQQKRDDLESRIEQHRKHQERRREKLEFMKTPREVANLMAEIDLARSVMATEEGEWVRASDQVGVLENRRREAQGKVEELVAAQREARDALEASRKELEQERAQAQARRDASASQVDRPLVQRYDRLRNSRRTRVVVALSGPACGACFTTVPLSRRNQIRAGAVIESCESCGVILYSDE